MYFIDKTINKILKPKFKIHKPKYVQLKLLLYNMLIIFNMS